MKSFDPSASKRNFDSLFRYLFKTGAAHHGTFFLTIISSMIEQSHISLDSTRQFEYRLTAIKCLMESASFSIDTLCDIAVRTAVGFEKSSNKSNGKKNDFFCNY
jgi:hypothetical protein